MIKTACVLIGSWIEPDDVAQRHFCEQLLRKAVVGIQRFSEERLVGAVDGEAGGQKVTFA